jgi:hypothetical protein
LVYVTSRTLQDGAVDTQYYHFTTDADEATVRAVLAPVSERCELTFFDAQHPQVTDPGAYIHVVHMVNRWIAQCGNTGWSSSWVPVTEDQATRYLLLCIPFHSPPNAQYVTLTEPSNWRQRGQVSTWRWNSFRRYLKRRLAGPA